MFIVMNCPAYGQQERVERRGRPRRRPARRPPAPPAPALAARGRCAGGAGSARPSCWSVAARRSVVRLAPLDVASASQARATARRGNRSTVGLPGLPQLAQAALLPAQDRQLQDVRPARVRALRLERERARLGQALGLLEARRSAARASPASSSGSTGGPASAARPPGWACAAMSVSTARMSPNSSAVAARCSRPSSSRSRLPVCCASRRISSDSAARSSRPSGPQIAIQRASSASPERRRIAEAARHLDRLPG